MRSIKITTIFTLAIGLLAISAAGAAAQDEEALSAAYFAGTIRGSSVVGEPTDEVVDGLLRSAG